MKLLSHFFLLLLSLKTQTLWAQFSPDDSQAWTWTRVEGSIDEQDLRILDKPIQYSMEVHYRDQC